MAAIPLTENALHKSEMEYNGTVSYLTVFTDYVINTTNNEISFIELTRVFEEYFEIKVQ